MSVPEAVHYVPHVLGGSGLLALVVWLLKNLFSNIKDAWNGAITTLNRIDETSRVANSNHLVHIQESTTKTNEILEAMRLGQVETNTLLKTFIDLQS